MKPSKFNLYGTLTLPLSVTLASTLEEQIDELYRLADSPKASYVNAVDYARCAGKLMGQLHG